MSNLLYLGIALAVSVVGILALWLRNRRPQSLEAGIEQFQRELRALGPQQPPTGEDRDRDRDTRDRRSAG